MFLDQKFSWAKFLLSTHIFSEIFLFSLKLSFNFNYNLVESWVSINLIFHTHHPPNHHPPTRRKSLKITWSLNLNPNLNFNLNLN